MVSIHLLQFELILIVLISGIDYVKYLQNQTVKQKEQEAELEKEVQALRIVKEWVLWIGYHTLSWLLFTSTKFS